ncbi:MAG TPA: PASTA domain-containing protein [Acidobacteriaceae bacterium]|nr:PASTA domain-containing protein [Acidobacteriaceae bacterium]
MKRFFTFALGALAMAAVALISMFITMRIAIHGREAVVPRLTGMSVADAAREAGHVGLSLTIENRFYSSEVPAGRVLAQDPSPDSRVRREWPIRVTESLGAQRVDVPDLTGESERAATVSIRRLALEPGVVGRLAVGGDPDVVIAQTPEPNSAGATGPRVSLLVSDAAAPAAQAWVMPQLVGLTYAEAAGRAASTGLQIQATSSAVPAPQPGAGPEQAAPAPAPPSVIHPGSIVTAQTPAAGFRVQQGDVVHVTVQEPAAAPATAAEPMAVTITRAN